jgi:hypothetical protein
MNGFLMGNVKSKTSWLGILLMVFGVLQDQWTMVQQLIPVQYAGRAFALVGLLVLILRNVTSESITEKAENKQGGQVHIALVSILCVTTLLFACETFRTNESLFHLATDAAVVKFIENSSAEKKQSRKEHIRSIALAVKGASAGDTSVSVGLLRQQVNVQIDKLGLSPTDRFLANELVEVLATELQARLGPDILNSDQKVQVSKVMDWIIQAVSSLPE